MSHRTPALCLVLIGILSTATVASPRHADATPGEWATYAGGPRRLFFNESETQVHRGNVASLRTKWSFLTGGVITASPSVAVVDLPGEGPTQVVFIQSWDHHLYAVRLSDGSEVWRFLATPHLGSTFPNVSSADVSVVAGQQRVHFSAAQSVYALDARTGEEIWHFDAGTGCADPPGLCAFDGERNQVESSPIIADGLLFFGMDIDDREGGKGGFYAVDAETGYLAWFLDIETGSTCRPLPRDQIQNFDGYHTEAELGLEPGFFSSRPGCDFDRTPTGCGNVWSSAAIDADRGLLFIATSNCDTDTNANTLKPDPPMPLLDEAIVAIHLDGTFAWSWRPREVDNADLAFGAVPNLFSIDVDGTPRDVVGVGNKDGTYYALDREGVNMRNGVRWDSADPSGLPYWATNVVPGGRIGGILATATVDEAAEAVFFSTAPGFDVSSPQRPTVHALDANSGAILWQNTDEPFADAAFSPMSGIPGVVFAGSVLGGFIRAYDSLSGERIARVGVAFTMASAPALVDGTVLIGGGSGQQGPDPHDQADVASRTPSNLTALCVPGTLACDGDQDGFDFPDECDDTNPDANPAAREIPDNAVDENCDGLLAYSDDECRAGGSRSPDEADLARARDQIEDACPCDSFDGTAGRGRAAYRRCAMPIVRQALADGRLRKHCVRPLLRNTCGRPRAGTCCRVRRRDGAASCLVLPGDRCRDSTAFERESCETITHCSLTDCATERLCEASE